MTLHVVVTFVARPDAVGQLRPLLASLVEPIRGDPGCSRCHLVINTDDGNEFVFIEEWASAQALDRHLSDAFIAEVVAQAKPMLAQPLTLLRYDVV